MIYASNVKVLSSLLGLVISRSGTPELIVAAIQVSYGKNVGGPAPDAVQMVVLKRYKVSIAVIMESRGLQGSCRCLILVLEEHGTLSY